MYNLFLFFPLFYIYCCISFISPLVSPKAPLDYVRPEAFQIVKSSLEYSTELSIHFKTPLVITNARYGGYGMKSLKLF